MKKLFHNFLTIYSYWRFYESTLISFFLRRVILFHNLLLPSYPNFFECCLKSDVRSYLLVSFVIVGRRDSISLEGSWKWVTNFWMATLLLVPLSPLTTATILNPAAALRVIWLWVMLPSFASETKLTRSSLEIWLKLLKTRVIPCSRAYLKGPRMY